MNLPKLKTCISITAVMLAVAASIVEATDSVAVLNPGYARYSYDAIPKDPLASAILSATIPGTGQIYNKEYVRGIINMGVYYGSFVMIRGLINRWQKLNTDTFYIQEVDSKGEPTGYHRPVYAPKADEQRVGLPKGEKGLLVLSTAVWVGSWVWSIYDAYKGAQRYNKIHFAQKDAPVEVRFVYNSSNCAFGVGLDIALTP